MNTTVSRNFIKGKEKEKLLVMHMQAIGRKEKRAHCFTYSSLMLHDQVYSSIINFIAQELAPQLNNVAHMGLNHLSQTLHTHYFRQ